MTASSWGVEREQLHHREWMSLPLPSLSEAVINSIAAVVDAAAGGESEESWRPKLNSIVEEAFNLTPIERQVIRDSLTIRWSELRFGWTSPAYAAPTDAHLRSYAAALQAHLNELEVGLWRVWIAQRAHGLAMISCRQRGGGATPEDAEPHFSIAQLVSEDASQEIAGVSPVTIIEPEAIVLDGTSVHLIKPDRLSCWMISTARDEAANVFSALLTGQVADLQDVDA